MKKLLIISLITMLVGCVAVPVTQNFPRASDTLQVPPPALKEIPADSTASQVFDIVIENYGTYNEVANQLRGWQLWYIEQKKIFDGMN